MSLLREVRDRDFFWGGEGREGENTWRGGLRENEHMASIAFSLLHHQICTILIRTLGFSFFSLPPFSIMSALSDVQC